MRGAAFAALAFCAAGANSIAAEPNAVPNINIERQKAHVASNLLIRVGKLKSAGQHIEAILILRQVLRDNPSNIHARQELAHSLLFIRKYNQSSRQFKRLLRLDPRPQLQRKYRGFLNHINHSKPVDIRWNLSMLPSTNINRGTTNSVLDTSFGQFVIDDSSKPSSGIGLKAGVSGYFRHRFNSNDQISLGWSTSAVFYDNADYNSLTGTISLTFEHETKRGSWKISPYLISNWRKSSANSDVIGLHFSAKHRLTPKTVAGFSVNHESRTYHGQDYNSGPFTTANLWLSHLVQDDLQLRIGLGADYGRPRSSHLQYDSYRISGAFSKTWKSGIFVSAGLELGTRSFLGDFPLMETPREGKYYKISASFQNPKITYAGFTPKVACSFTNNFSNVAFFDYSVTECQISIGKSF